MDFRREDYRKYRNMFYNHQERAIQSQGMRGFQYRRNKVRLQKKLP